MPEKKKTSDEKDKEDAQEERTEASEAERGGKEDLREDSKTEEGDALERPNELQRLDSADQVSGTLLPAPLANAVSLVTTTSSLYLRLGSFVGGLALDGARITTLTGLEVGRAVIEGILSRAGRDISTRSTGELGRLEAEGILERSIARLHSTINGISFAASTGFYISAAALSSAGDISQQLLVGLDSVLGSTDSSRAIASIITLIRREFQNPATGQEGEKVGVSDLLLGICGLALLQRWCQKITEEESRKNGEEYVVWDVVILNDGRRADVVDTSDASKGQALVTADSASFMTANGSEIVRTIERQDTIHEESDDDDSAEVDLKLKIMQSLPEDASVSITTQTSTTKTITVEITGTQPSDLSPPPGVEIVEENAHHTEDINVDGMVLTNEQKLSLLVPRYRVVYRIVKDKIRGTNVDARSSLEEAQKALIDQTHLNRDESLGDNVVMPPPLEADEPKPPMQLLSSPLPQHSPHPPTLQLEEPSLPVVPPVPEKDEPVLEFQTRRTSLRSIDSGNEKSSGRSSRSSPKIPENTANQKRSRKPRSSTSSVSELDTPPKKHSGTKSNLVKKSRPHSKPPPPEKRSSFRNTVKNRSSTALSHLWNKDHGEAPSSKPSRPPWGGVGGGASIPPTPPSSTKSSIIPPPRNTSLVPARNAPKAPQRGNPNYFSSKDLGQQTQRGPIDSQRAPSRTSYYSFHDTRRDSMVSQTDTYSLHSAETRPGSPTQYRTHLRTSSNFMRAKSEKTSNNAPLSPAPPSPVSRRGARARAYVPSIYTLKTNDSTTSLVLSHQPRGSAFEDAAALEGLSHTGFVDGIFPQHHIVRNITRFVRFATASYGASFLQVMGIATSETPKLKEIDTKHHHEHHSFSTHTQLPPDTILLSSFVDPQGGTDSSGKTNTNVAMVHFVSLDHDSKAVVLTCRGTLGFEDVLTDMTCEYDELMYRGKAYKVHKGIHASARRLTEGRVMATITAALEEYPDYGLVMCGHSLGGAVTALLAIMVSEPSPDPNSTAFFTKAEYAPQQLLLMEKEGVRGTAPIKGFRLPEGRPIHVYAYGPAASVSPSLRLATRGLITSVVNGQDLIPFLSLGVLHDLQAVALAFKTDDTGAKSEVRKRVWGGITGTFADKWYSSRPSLEKDEDDQWAYSALKALRASMLSHKLYPPGEVFILETMPVLQRDAFVKRDDGVLGTGMGSGIEGIGGGRGALGRPATRCVLRYVRDVEKRFGEVRFGGSILMDHIPGRYEANFGALGRGVLG